MRPRPCSATTCGPKPPRRRREPWSRPGPAPSPAPAALTSRDAFRALAKDVGAATGAKGKALFHTIRLCVTGAPEGPELDILVPAIDAAADFTPDDGLAPVLGCRERAAQFAAALGSVTA